MSKSVLISLQPKWCELIANGKKTVEVRKSRPKIDTPFKVYIYCTLQGSNEFFNNTLNGNISEWNKGSWGFKKGKVIGEFVCDEIETLRRNTVFNAPALYSQSCLNRDEYFDYIGNKTAYIWHISDLKVYCGPKDLSEFECLRKTKFGYEPIEIKRPPQSWCYVEERDINE